MNEHIRRGNESLARGDRNAAARDFYKALDDPDPLVKRIARNRLKELFPESVYASTHSFQRLYHRPKCRAKDITQANHIEWFRDYREAERAGRVACHWCSPLRTQPGNRAGPK